MLFCAVSVFSFVLKNNFTVKKSACDCTQCSVVLSGFERYGLEVAEEVNFLKEDNHKGAQR